MPIDTTSYRVKLAFTTPLLGSLPGSKEVFSDYIQSKARKLQDDGARGPLNEDQAQEELDALHESAEKTKTQFYKDAQGRPFLMDYQAKGFLSEAANVLKPMFKKVKKREAADGDFTLDVSTIVKRYAYVFPRRIPIMFEGPIGELQRPLRAMTMQGPRTSLANSEMIEGASVEFTLSVLAVGGLKMQHLEDLLSFGMFTGIGQWRSGGHGRFTVESFTRV